MNLGSFVTFMTLLLVPGSHGQKRLQVNILFRHGDRSPTKTFPTDPYKESSWPRGWGQLSKLGQERHLELGKFFRRRYPDLIGEYYHPWDIYVRSTDVDRTLMSAASNLAGLYPPKGNETWTSEILGWEPLPIHTVPHSADNVLVRGNNCPRYNAMCRELWTTRPTPEVVKENTEFADFWRDVRKNAGLAPQVELSDLWFISDALKIERLVGRKLPDWVDASVFQHLMEYQDLNFKMMVYNQTLARLSGGNLLNEMQNNMKAKLKGHRTKKVYVYSAHDDTVAPLLAALNVYNNLAPPYASAIMLELWETEKKDPFVRLFYRNDTSINPETPLFLTIPGCTADCPWAKFLKSTRSSIPSNYAKECLLPAAAVVAQKIHDTHPIDLEESRHYVSDEIRTTSVPTLKTSSDGTAWFVFGTIVLVLSVLFIVVFILFVFLRSYRIRIVVSRDEDREPLLSRQRSTF